MTLTDTTFRTSITVEAPIERAFTVFTERFDAWWPRSHHIGTADMAEAMLEPRVGGRWHERGVDGSECEWGRVLAWDPPRHVAMSWHLNGAFRYDPDPDKASRVDVRFIAESESLTRGRAGAFGARPSRIRLDRPPGRHLVRRRMARAAGQIRPNRPSVRWPDPAAYASASNQAPSRGARTRPDRGQGCAASTRAA
jgi:uncharacterized protein YndB with AHSA1/START domain